MENLDTYVNRNGFPMIRRCKNCVFWSSDNDFKKIGYCKAKFLHFAFTLEKTAHPLTKEFCVCEEHKFQEEERLSQVCEKVKLKSILKKKEDIDTEKFWDDIENT